VAAFVDIPHDNRRSDTRASALQHVEQVTTKTVFIMVVVMVLSGYIERTTVVCMDFILVSHGKNPSLARKRANQGLQNGG
jgi:hypothetical protein